MTRRSIPKVTVVVPVYKVEKYLNECVDSILGQTLKNIEVILVDDGSPDNCGKIIDEYAAADKRVVAVHQENAGYSVAVNRGIDMARGEYIGIIESDDWIEPDMYESLYKSAKKNKTDITKGMFYRYDSTATSGAQNVIYKNPSGVDLSFAPDGVFTTDKWPKILAFHASIWSSIYRADFIKKIKIPESAGASYQDFPFMVDFLSRAKRITVVKHPFVHWRNDPKQGNSTSARGEKLLLMAKNSQLGLEIAKKSKNYSKYKEALFAHILWANYGFFEKIDRKYKKEYFNLMHAMFDELNTDSSFTFKYFDDYYFSAAKYFMNKDGLGKYKFHHLLHCVKYKILSIARCIFPTYRTITFIKEQNWEMQNQIETLTDIVVSLQKKIDKK